MLLGCNSTKVGNHLMEWCCMSRSNPVPWVIVLYILKGSTEFSKKKGTVEYIVVNWVEVFIVALCKYMEKKPLLVYEISWWLCSLDEIVQSFLEHTVKVFGATAMPQHSFSRGVKLFPKTLATLANWFCSSLNAPPAVAGLFRQLLRPTIVPLFCNSIELIDSIVRRRKKGFARLDKLRWDLL